jgi:hypothetical protein
MSEGHLRVCSSTENRANEFARGNQLLKVHPQWHNGEAAVSKGPFQFHVD